MTLAPEEATTWVRERALELGADDVGVAALEHWMIAEGHSTDHDFAVAVIVAEDYGAVRGGPRGIEREAFVAYARCAEITNTLAGDIRAAGHPAIAHHAGGCELQAVAVAWAAGLGELGRHGSLIHPEFGASFRIGAVSTTLPLRPPTPIDVGVQDFCLTCRLCINNCPGDAIPLESETFQGIRRWITDVERCYEFSRLRPEYCHICVDVCPYVHRMSTIPDRRDQYREYRSSRRLAGQKTPAWFPGGERPNDGPDERDASV